MQHGLRKKGFIVPKRRCSCGQRTHQSWHISYFTKLLVQDTDKRTLSKAWDVALEWWGAPKEATTEGIQIGIASTKSPSDPFGFPHLTTRFVVISNLYNPGGPCFQNRNNLPQRSLDSGHQALRHSRHMGLLGKHLLLQYFHSCDFKTSFFSILETETKSIHDTCPGTELYPQPYELTIKIFRKILYKNAIFWRCQIIYMGIFRWDFFFDWEK